MGRTLGVAAALAALAAGAYQLWRALQLRRTATTYADSIGFLVQGHPHYPAVFHNFSVWLNVEALLALLGGVALLVGAALLALRKAFGVRGIAGGSAVVITHTAVGWIVAAKMIPWFNEIGAEDYGSLWFNTPSSIVIIALSFALPVGVLALISLSARRRSA